MRCSDFSCPCCRFGTGDRGSRSCGLLFFHLGHSELCPPKLPRALFCVWPCCPCLLRAESDCDLTLFLLARAWHCLCEQHLLLEGREDDLFCKSGVGMLKRFWMGEKMFFRFMEGAWRHAQDGGKDEGIPKVIKGWGNLGFLQASFPWASPPFFPRVSPTVKFNLEL